MAIATTAQYKAYANISGSGDDTFYDTCVAAADELICKYCNRTSFDTGTYTERHSMGPDQATFTTRVYPITSITSITRKVGSGQSVTITSTAYEYDSKSGIVRLYGAGGDGRQCSGSFWHPLLDDGCDRPSFAEGTLNHEIVYVGGYASDAMPAGLKMALYRAVDWMRGARGRDSSLQSESIGAYSYTLKAPEELAAGLPAEVLGMLASYRREGT